MNEIAKENADLMRNAQENLAKKIAAIENEGSEEIKRLAIEAEKHTAARIAEIREEYRAKGDSVKEEFVRDGKKMRGKIFHDILHAL